MRAKVMSHADQGPFPKPALIATAGLLGLTLAFTAAVRVAKLSLPAPPPVAAEAPARAVDLRFADAADGSIRVAEAGSGRAVAVLAPGGDGFVRGVLRGMARDRISRRIGEAPAFRLSQTPAGRLTIQDTATGRTIDLEAFGTVNREAFARFLPGSERRS